MTRRAAPLLVDRLPLYLDDKALRAAVCPAADDGAWRSLTMAAGFPRPRPWGGRHVPSVLSWFEAYEGTGAKPAPEKTDEEMAAIWNTPRNRRTRRV